MKPKIDVEYVDDVTVATIMGEEILEEVHISELRNSLTSLVEQGGQIKLVLDFRNVRFLSSAVLGLLIRVLKKIYEQDGRLRLCGIDPKIQEVFKITRLNQIFDIYDDVDSAVASFSDED